MKKGKLSASMMCAHLDKIFYYLAEFKQTNLELLHIDIMDGEFVPNFALGTDYIKSLRRITDIPFDFHFLTNNPLEKMSWFDIRENDQVAFHVEGNQDIDKCISYVDRIGAKVFLAINPDTDYHEVEKYLNDIDGLLIMMVNPGFAGKRMLPHAIERFEQIVTFITEAGYGELELEVDGNITFEHAQELYGRGATIFVAGSSSLFKSTEQPVKDLIEKMRKLIGWE